MTFWDLGYSDDTTIIFAQIIYGEIRIIDYHSSNGKSIPFYTGLIEQKGYEYDTHWLPHDARAKTLASGGKSIIEQMAAKIPIAKMKIVPSLSLQDGIQATRMALLKCWFDEEKTIELIECLKQYQREYDEDKKVFRDKPRHDWASHGADAMRMLAIAWSEEVKVVDKDKPIHGIAVGLENKATLNDLWKDVRPAKPTRY
jgi:phage terminase large subunit